MPLDLGLSVETRSRVVEIDLFLPIEARVVAAAQLVEGGGFRVPGMPLEELIVVAFAHGPGIARLDSSCKDETLRGEGTVKNFVSLKVDPNRMKDRFRANSSN